MKNIDRDDVLATVQASPLLVAAHDRDEWLALFAEDYEVQDPVGAPAVQPGDEGVAPLGRFWDTFIATNQVRFEVHRDIVVGLSVARDVTIVTQMPQGVTVTTPAHLFYELEPGARGLVIRRMHAHWELGPVLRQSLRPTWSHLRALASQNARMLRIQGLRGTLGFGAAVRSLGDRGRQSLLATVEDAHGGDPRALELTGPQPPEDLAHLIVAGDWVTACATVGGRPAIVRARVERGSLDVVDYACFAEPPR